MAGQMENKGDMPMGFSFQLGMNSKAMDAYGKLNDEEKRQVIEAARNVTTKSEMHWIVEGRVQNFC
nr:hypothetical protein [uncultured Acetatifactor sp.]